MENNHTISSKVLVVDYERWSFPKGSDYRDLTGKSLVVWMGGRTGRFDCNLWVRCEMHDFQALSVEHFYSFWKIIHCVLCSVVFVITFSKSIYNKTI